MDTPISESTQWIAEINNSERSKSYVYFTASTQDAANIALDTFLAAHCIDPYRVTRFGNDFDA